MNPLVEAVAAGHASEAEASGTDPAYPPEPWNLQGNFAVGIFLVPVRELPGEVLAHLPSGARPLTIAGCAPVGMAAARYTPGGVLTYDELLVALPVVHRGQLSVTIPQIWVTSPASQAGGRELWGIPKALMSAQRRSAGPRLQAMYRAEDRAILAEMTATGRMSLPGRWRLPLPTLQRQDSDRGFIRSTNSVRGRLGVARTEWTFGAALSWLRGRRPLLGVAITRAAVTFGARVDR